MNPVPFRNPSPWALLSELGVDRPQDIRLEPIAQFCGVTILYEKLSGSEARLIGFGDRAIVTINENSSLERRRFSAAHELGHWMRDRGKTAFCCDESEYDSPGCDDEAERRANRYAADLLMPPSMFRPRARGAPVELRTIKTLARDFQTSLSATAIRYAEMGDGRFMVVYSERNQRKWYAASHAAAGSKPQRDLPSDVALLRSGTAQNRSWESWLSTPAKSDLVVEGMDLGSDRALWLLSWTEE